jgi:RNA polymerase sigma factor (sigma-70 family)
MDHRGNQIDSNRSLTVLDPNPGVSLAAEDARSLVQGLVTSHGTQLRRFLLARVRNVADVPDIVQEVYLRMLRVPKIESIRSPEAYLFTVAQHVVQQHTLRQSATAPSVELSRMLESPAATTDVDPALELDALQCLERLQGALEEMSPKMRATFILHRRDGLSFEEISDRLGVSRSMAKKHLMNALRQRLERAE